MRGDEGRLEGNNAHLLSGKKVDEEGASVFELCEEVATSSVFGDYVQDGGEREGGIFGEKYMKEHGQTKGKKVEMLISDK